MAPARDWIDGILNLVVVEYVRVVGMVVGLHALHGPGPPGAVERPSYFPQ